MLDALTTPGGDEGLPDIIFVTPELLGSAGGMFHQFLAFAAVAGRLRAVIVDEAHTLLQHASFRPAMSRVVWVRRLGVPLIALTGTLPRALEPALRSTLLFGVVSGGGAVGPTWEGETLRGSLQRPNVRL